MKSLKRLPVLIAGIVLLSGCSTERKQTNDRALPKEDHATALGSTIEVPELDGKSPGWDFCGCRGEKYGGGSHAIL